jgi:CrcB protein
VTAVVFVLAAAAGSLLRAEAGRRWNGRRGLAAGTLAVNVVGSFLAGLLASHLGPPWSTVVVVGGLGALTTFSSFARDAVALVEERRPLAAAGYVGLTLALAMGACALGTAVA